jgi:regulator of sigma E protease
VDILAAVTDLAGWTSTVTGILGTAVGLGLVIFLHELGHFAVAKWCNVYVERFSIGFGPILLSWKWGETEYALSAIPFGGYVKMLGQDDADPSQMTSEEIAADPRSYVSKNVWQRMAIISAGVTMNVITAVLFIAVGFGLGAETQPPVIGHVRPGHPAWVAGVRRGDTIQRFNGREVTSFQELAVNIAVSNGPIELSGKRRTGEKFSATVHPDTAGTRPQIGIGPSSGLTLADDPQGKESPVVAGSAAAAAEPAFQPGDTLVKVDGQEITSFAELQTMLAERKTPQSSITVQRKTGQELVDITVGARQFRTLGLRMTSGSITAVQADTPAAAAGLQAGDKIARVNGRSVGTDIDPLRLPNVLAELHGQPVEIVITRQNKTGGDEEKTITLVPDNRPGWLEQPEQEGEPLSIPAIGVAFHVSPFIWQVDPDSPAAEAGLQAGQHPANQIKIQKVVLVLPPGTEKDSLKDERFTISLDAKGSTNNWAFAFWMMQQFPRRQVELTVLENVNAQPRTVTMTPVEDPSWMLPTIGLRMMALVREEKAESVGQALSMAWRFSRNTLLVIYQTLRSLGTGRLSVKELHGPVGIAQAAYKSANAGIVPLLFFLGYLSLNLAVINFLPIPVLDGGHMVFLIYEAVTRRRPSEKVLVGSLYVGMAFLLSLMVLVLYLDFFVHGLGLDK